MGWVGGRDETMLGKKDAQRKALSCCGGNSSEGRGSTMVLRHRKPQDSASRAVRSEYVASRDVDEEPFGGGGGTPKGQTYLP